MQEAIHYLTREMVFERTQTRLNIRAEDTYNIDKTIIALGVYVNARALTRVGKRKAYIKSLKNSE